MQLGHERLEALLDAAGLPAPRVILGRVGGGSSHETWQVCASGRMLVARVALPAPRYAAPLAAETQVLPAVAAADLAPTLLYYDERDGSHVSVWHPGCTWTVQDLTQPARLRRLAALLARLHGLQLDCPEYDLSAAVEGYRRILHDEAQQDACLRKRLDLLSECSQRFDAQKRVTGLAHNDLVVNNLIGYTRLRLLDWEYAGRNDRLFDIATLTGLHDLSRAQRARVVDVFSLSAQERQRLPETEKLVRLLAWVWARAECLRRPEDPRPARWLDALKIA